MADLIALVPLMVLLVVVVRWPDWWGSAIRRDAQVRADTERAWRDALARTHHSKTRTGGPADCTCEAANTTADKER